MVYQYYYSDTNKWEKEKQKDCMTGLASNKNKNTTCHVKTSGVLFGGLNHGRVHPLVLLWGCFSQY